MLDFETVEQEKGYLAMKYWAHKHGYEIFPRREDLFFIQKFHDTGEWMTKMFAEQIKDLQQEIMVLKEKIKELENGI